MTDHPRSRGEYIRAGGRPAGSKGSSPLSRGIPSVPARPWPGRGIIPALAGNTRRHLLSGAVAGDHPRSRGEYFAACSSACSAAGSSPLSRGIPTKNGWRIAHIGIIPALAGNTRLPSAEPPPSPDHPRSRGEYIWALAQIQNVSGSSPLSRGIQFISNNNLHRLRIIPALAGNTR